MAPQKRIQELRTLLERANRAYYVDARPVMSDAEFDRLLAELATLEAEHPQWADADSPTQRVGGAPIAGFEHRPHAQPMLSIDNCNKPQSLCGWAERCFVATDPAIQEIAEELRSLEAKADKKDRPASGEAGGLFGPSTTWPPNESREERAEVLRHRRAARLAAWASAGCPGTYACDPKVDGVAISLRYEQGRLAYALTRGDGATGDDVTHAARVIRAIPLRLAGKAPAVLEVRGEVYMTTAAFERINRELEAAGEEALANPRNATAGTLKSLDPGHISRRRLSFVAHGRGEVSPGFAASHSEFMARVRELGLPTSPHAKVCGTVDEVLHTIAKFESERRTLDHATDGMVVRLDAFEAQGAMGRTSKSPRWILAYKYPPDRTMTVLLDVLHQVGKTGKITPRAVMKPVLLAGTTVQHATLHNYGQVVQKDIHLGDTVEIEKAGEIIPSVVGVVRDRRPEGARAVQAPHLCPECGGPIEVEYKSSREKELNEYEAMDEHLERILRSISNATSERQRQNAMKKRDEIMAKQSAPAPLPLSPADETGRFCLNPECPAQWREHLVWFTGRRQMDIANLGEKTIDKILKAGTIPFQSFADVFNLRTYRMQLAAIDGLGAKTLDSLLASIEDAKGRGLATVLASMNIHHIGHATSRSLAKRFGSIDALLAAPLRDLMPRAVLSRRLATALGISHQRPGGPDTGLGLRTALSVYEYLHSDRGQRTFRELRNAGVDLTAKEEPHASAFAGDSPITGKVFVITGSLEVERDVIQRLIESLGGRCSASVSGNTDILIAGEAAGSKFEKARSLGVAVWDESELVAALKQAGLNYPPGAAPS